MKATNIFLIGLMGSGKTTIGKLLAKKLNRSFIDTDQLIEQKTGVDVSMIFEFEGERGFRDRETKLLSDLSEKLNHVISTGGGVVLSKFNRDIISNSGTTFYLKTYPKELSLRLKNDKTRPLLKNTDVEKKLTELYEERCSLYEAAADYIIETKNKRAAEIVLEIEEKLNSYENN